MKKPSQKKRKKKGTRKRIKTAPKPKVISSTDAVSIQEKGETEGKGYPTIPKNRPEKGVEDKGNFLKYVNVAGQFLRESKMELKKVKWPTRKELLASTAMVILLVLVVALFLGLIDFGLIKIIKNIVG